MAKKVHLSLDIHSSVLCISEDGEGTEVLQVIIPRERRVFYLKYTTALFAEKKKKKICPYIFLSPYVYIAKYTT